MKRSALALAAMAALLSTLAAPALAQRAGGPPAGTSASSGGGRTPGSDAGTTSPDQGASGSTTSSKPPKIDQAALERGMKEAPALQQASGQACQITAAAFRGEGPQKGADGKTRKSTVYETACASGLGFLLVSPQGGTPQAFDCLAAQGTNTACALPQNADAKPGLASLVTAAGGTCAVSNARYVGGGDKSDTYYEVACGAQPGLLVIRPANGAAQLEPCAAVLDRTTEPMCKFTTKAQVVAGLQPAVQASGRPCQVSDARYIGAGTQTGNPMYEVACGASPGFVVEVDKTGAYKQAVNCSRVAGGCKMTTAEQSAAVDNAAYVAALSKAGYDCQVSKTRPIGTDSKGREVVELACANHPDGAIALLSKTGGPSEIVDCGRAEYAGGQSCQLTPVSAVYPKYTAALASKVKGACTVSNTVYAGGAASEQFVETACADGRRGYVIGFNGPTFSVKEVLTCSQARFQGLACKLPGDTTAK